MYKQASRLNLRFSTSCLPKPVADITTEQLWQLSLNNLNILAKSLKKDYDASGGESFLDEVSEKDKIIKLQFDIVLDVLTTKRDEQEAVRIKNENRIYNEKIMSLIADKEAELLKSSSIDDLKKMLKH